VNLYTAHE